MRAERQRARQLLMEQRSFANVQLASATSSPLIFTRPPGIWCWFSKRSDAEFGSRFGSRSRTRGSGTGFGFKPLQAGCVVADCLYFVLESEIWPSCFVVVTCASPFSVTVTVQTRFTQHTRCSVSRTPLKLYLTCFMRFTNILLMFFCLSAVCSLWERPVLTLRAYLCRSTVIKAPAGT
jgi:hypothetical protein